MNKKLIFGVAAVLAMAAGLGWHWRQSTLYPSTEDAYIGANIVTVAAQVTGQVMRVHVADNAPVKAGEPLFDLDDTLYRNALTQAEAQLEAAVQAADSFARQVEAAQAAETSAKTAFDTAQAQFHRVERLHHDGNAAQAALDQARSAMAQARAALDEAGSRVAQAGAAQAGNLSAASAAEAALESARTNLARARVTSPVTGWVANLTLREGSVVSAYAPLFSLVDGSDWWVDANFKETDLTRLQPGQPVLVKVDMLPGQNLTGKIASIGRGSGSTFALLPAENASGNWVKVTQRFAVRVELDAPGPDLRVGASAVVTVDTTGAP